MTIEIREVKNKRDLKSFIRYPLSLYKGNPYYVPSLFLDEMNTLRSDKNPAFVPRTETRGEMGRQVHALRLAGFY
jgi:hypothetical protein